MADHFVKVPDGILRSGTPGKLGASAFVVYLELLSMRNADGKAWPSYAGMASMTGFAVSTVRESFARLESAGVIYRESSGRNNGYVYTVLSAEESVPKFSTLEHAENQQTQDSSMPKSGTQVCRNPAGGMPKSGTQVCRNPAPNKSHKEEMSEEDPVKEKVRSVHETASSTPAQESILQSQEPEQKHMPWDDPLDAVTDLDSLIEAAVPDAALKLFTRDWGEFTGRLIRDGWRMVLRAEEGQKSAVQMAKQRGRWLTELSASWKLKGYNADEIRNAFAAIEERTHDPERPITNAVGKRGNIVGAFIEANRKKLADDKLRRNGYGPKGNGRRRYEPTEEDYLPLPKINGFGD